MNSPKPKRVVSKAEYARIMARNAMMTALSVVCLSVGVFVAIAFIIFWLNALRTSFAEQHTNLIAASLLGATVTLFGCGSLAKRKVETAEVVRPATRKAVENLPATDILVRASDAPQTPEAVLLRAAQEQETPQEQLLRAAE